MRPMLLSALSAASLLALSGCDLLSQSDDAPETQLGEDGALRAAQALLDDDEAATDASEGDTEVEGEEDRESGGKRAAGSNGSADDEEENED